jgi:hypothetical protein
MSFLTPLYLFALGAAALPVLLHLFRNTVRRRIPFSAVRFVEAVPSRTTRRMQVEHWPLMLLRVTALCLLALAFARPWLRLDAASEPEAPGRRVIVLLDTSASMQREGLWKQALHRLDETLATLESKDELALATFDRRTQWHLTAQEWNALPTLAARIELARTRLKDLKPGWSSTHLDSAFLTALESCAKSSDPHASTPYRTELIVISDLSSGTHLDTLKDHDWPRDVTVVLHTVSSPRTTNASLQLVVGTSEASATAATQKVRVKVSNSADATESRFQLAWAADPASPYEPDAPITVTVPAGQSRTLLIPAPAPNAASPTAKNEKPKRLILTGDDHPFDNTLDILARPKHLRTILYHGDDRSVDPSGCRYFLDRAFSATATREVHIITLDERSTNTRSTQGAALSTLGAESIDVGGVARPESSKGAVGAAKPRGTAGADSVDDQVERSNHALRRASGRATQAGEAVPDLAVITAPLVPFQLDILHSALAHGTTILILAKEASAAETFAALTQIAPLPIEEATLDGFALLADLDFSHPAWQPFRDPQYADFSRIHIWKHRRVTLPDSAASPSNLRILARYDNSAPALIEHQSTKGRVLLLTTTWSPKDSQLALAAKFAPFLNALLELNQASLTRTEFEAGEAIAWSDLGLIPNDSSEVDSVILESPEAERITTPRSTDFSPPRPGVYAILDVPTSISTSASEGPQLSTFAVRIPSEESRTAPLALESLAALGVPVSRVSDGISPIAASSPTTSHSSARHGSQADATAVSKELQQRGWRWFIVAALIVLLIETAWSTRLAQCQGRPHAS